MQSSNQRRRSRSTQDQDDQDDDDQDQRPAKRRVGNSSNSPRSRCATPIQQDRELTEANGGEPQAPITTAKAKPQVAECGVIEQVELVNFLAHSYFVVPLQPLQNFIIGHNGSGKSAILTGITIALGGKTSATSRATSLKGLVKHGANYAIVSITLKNQGADAFKPNEYGAKIIIERRIHVEGTATWKLKSEAGKTVATTKAELDAVCDCFGIHVDNPLSILTQDSARRFLGQTDPSELYNFYWEGTQLGQLSRVYEQLAAQTHSMSAIVKQRENQIEHLRVSAEQAREVYEHAQAARDYSKKIDHLNEKLVWAQVTEKEKELEDATAFLEQHKEKLVSVQNELDRVQGEIDRYNEVLTTGNDQLRGFDDQGQPLSDELEGIKRSIVEKGKQLKPLVEEETALRDQNANIRGVIENLQQQIKVESAKQARDGSSQRAELEAKREDLQQRRRNLQDEETEKREDLGELMIRQRTKSEELQEAQRLRTSHREKLENLESQLHNLHASSSNELSAFGGANVPRLLAQIDRYQGWRKKPVGPLGVHVKLKDLQWAQVLESVIGNTMNAFFVTNYEDRKKLTQLMAQANTHAFIIKGSEELFDYSAGEPDQNILTILRVLEFDDEAVKRQFIVQVHIEKMGLAPSRARGETLMRSRPHNVTMCHSLDLFGIKGVAGDRGSVSSAHTVYKGPSRFSRDHTQEIRSVTAERQALEQEIRHAHQRVETLQYEKTEIDRKLNEAKKALPALQTQINNCTWEINRIADDLRVNEPGNIGALEESRCEAELEAQKIREQFEEVQQRKEEIQQGMEELKAEKDKLTSRKDSRKAAREEMVRKITRATEKRTHHVGNRQHWEAKIKEQEEAIDAATGEETDVRMELEQWTQEAEKYCDRIPVDQSLVEIEKQIVTTKEQKRKAESETGISIQQALADFQQKTQALKQAEEDVSNIQGVITNFHRVLEQREETLKVWRKQIAVRAKQKFRDNLQMRGFEGTLLFDHQARQLRPVVKTEIADKKEGDRKKEMMSGGEKSFATVCLLLSMWQAVNSPIRCLDEFDVYMDQANRRVALSLLLEAATDTVQYIFITPQNMPPNIDAERVAIYRISDPERANGLLSSSSS